MTWADFYLVCFLVGLALTGVSLLTGHVHLPHAHGVHLPHAHGVGHAPHGHASEVSAINFGTVTAFLAWFGGAGYLLTRYYGVWRWLGLGAAIATGLVGAAAVFWFVARVLVASDENLDPADYEMVGVLGRITSPIREGGTGELVFSQAGTRRTTGARSDDGAAVAKGTEVIVTRYERGIAYVRPWDELENTAKGGAS
jgi:membrane protein implicated in regulation of membrane protease activity